MPPLIPTNTLLFRSSIRILKIYMDTNVRDFKEKSCFSERKSLYLKYTKSENNYG